VPEHAGAERHLNEQPRDEPLFRPGELRLFRYTAVFFAGVLFVSLLVFVVWVLSLVLAVFSNLILPLLVAGLAGLVLYPVVTFLQQRLHVPRVAAVVILFVVISLALGLTLLEVLPAALNQLAEFFDTAPELLGNLQETLAREFPGAWAMIAARMESANLENVLPEFDSARQMLMSYLGMVVGLFFVPLFVYFILLSGDRLRDAVDGLLSVFGAETNRELVYLINVFVEYVTAFFQGQLIIALGLGGLLALGFTLIDLQAAIVFGLVLGAFNIVPYLGTIIGLLTVLPVAYLQPGGGIELVALTLLVFAAAQAIESLVLTPTIMADRSGLHPALVVISILFWGTALGGIMGMILAVPLTAFVVTLWRHFRAWFNRRLASDYLDVQTSQQSAHAEPAYRMKSGE
jgi:predicted PurR-regulated permease PerM